MPDDEKVYEEDEASEAEKASPEEIEKRIAERLGRQMDEKLSTNNSGLANLMADPQIRQILEARQKGENVELRVGNTIPPVEEEPDWDNLNNKDLVKELVKRLPRVIEQHLDKRVTPLDSELKGLKGYIESQEESKAKQQIDALKQKYPDFDAMKPQMASVLKDNPNLSFEELYVITKARSSGAPLTPTTTNTASERPTSETARSPRSSKRKTPLAQGRKGWDQMLDEALGGLE